MTDVINDRWLQLDESGEPVGPLRLDDAARGVLHASSHVWLWRQNDNEIEILMQRRAPHQTWAGYYDSAAAGHVDYGRTPLETVINEASEEIGVQLVPQNLHLVTVHRSYAMNDIDGRKIIENELQWVYTSKLSEDQTISFTDGEVIETAWVTWAELQAMIQGDDDKRRAIDHGDAYFMNVWAGIMRTAKRENHEYIVATT